MILSNDDLQAIRNIVNDEVKSEVDNQLQSINKLIDQKLDLTKKDLIKQIKIETKTIVKFFDREYLGHDKRIKRVENHLNLPPLDPATRI